MLYFSSGICNAPTSFLRGGKYLVTVTMCMRRRRRIAAVGCLQAMITGSITFFDMPFGNTVVAEQDMIIVLADKAACLRPLPQ